MDANEDDALIGGKGKVPSKLTSLTNPTPTSLYGITVLTTC